MTKAREFHLGTILSITDGHLLAPNKIDGVYDIVGHLLGHHGTSTIGLLAVHEPCKAELLRQFPHLVDVRMQDGDDWRAWLSEQVATFGAMHLVKPMAAPPAPRSVVDDILDIVRMNPNAEIIAVEP